MTVPEVTEKEGQAITEDEAALYDRQIRLWGLDAQKRLRAARVLLIGLGGLGAEVAKNLILAGVKSLTMMDPEPVTRADASCQFFLPADKLGQNRAEASVERAHRLNPMVDVTGVAAASSALSESDVTSSYDVIVATCLPDSELVRLNQLCRRQGRLFLAGDVYGFYGYMFSDLGAQHQYAEEVTTPAPKPAAAEPAPKRAKLDTSASAAAAETRTVRRTAAFSSLEDALAVTWESAQQQKLLRRTSSTYFIIRALQLFRASEGRRPLPATAATDAPLLLSCAGDVAKQLHVPADKIGTQFPQLCMGELSPACAVVGGVLSQEVIKAVSQKDKPLQSWFLFNADISEGVVQHVSA